MQQKPGDYALCEYLTTTLLSPHGQSALQIAKQVSKNGEMKGIIKQDVQRCLYKLQKLGLTKIVNSGENPPKWALESGPFHVTPEHAAKALDLLGEPPRKAAPSYVSEPPPPALAEQKRPAAPLYPSAAQKGQPLGSIEVPLCARQEWPPLATGPPPHARSPLAMNQPGPLQHIHRRAVPPSACAGVDRKVISSPWAAPGPTFCSVCRIETTSVENMAAHMQGKQHAKELRKKELLAARGDDALDKHPVSQVQEIAVSLGLGACEYAVVASDLSLPHAPQFTIRAYLGNFQAQATALNKAEAKRQAALGILRQLRR